MLCAQVALCTAWLNGTRPFSIRWILELPWTTALSTWYSLDHQVHRHNNNNGLQRKIPRTQFSHNKWVLVSRQETAFKCSTLHDIMNYCTILCIARSPGVFVLSTLFSMSTVPGMTSPKSVLRLDWEIVWHYKFSVVHVLIHLQQNCFATNVFAD